jgi:hypothetical protein
VATLLQPWQFMLLTLAGWINKKRSRFVGARDKMALAFGEPLRGQRSGGRSDAGAGNASGRPRHLQVRRATQPRRW